jgi:hypothetical protein
VSRSSAYLITDSRYWVQAQEQLDPNWQLVPAGGMNGPKDWIEWLVVREPLSKGTTILTVCVGQGTRIANRNRRPDDLT